MRQAIPEGMTRVILDVSPKGRRISVQLVPWNNTEPVVPFVRLRKTSPKEAQGATWVGYVGES